MVSVKDQGSAHSPIFTETGRQIYWLEAHPPEYEIRDFDPASRGRLRAVFLGANAFDQACRWLECHGAEIEKSLGESLRPWRT